MKLYKDYCSRCPQPIIEVDGVRRNGPRQPEKCRFCTATGLTDGLAAYLEAEFSIKLLRDEMSTAQRGVHYFEGRQKQFHTMIRRGHVEEGEYRVVRIGNQAVVLDYTTDTLVIKFALLEKS